MRLRSSLVIAATGAHGLFVAANWSATASQAVSWRHLLLEGAAVAGGVRGI